MALHSLFKISELSGSDVSRRSGSPRSEAILQDDEVGSFFYTFDMLVSRSLQSNIRHIWHMTPAIRWFFLLYQISMPYLIRGNSRVEYSVS